MTREAHPLKRICIFSPAYVPDIGGAEIAVAETTARIHDVHFDVITVAHTQNIPTKEQIGRVTVYRLGYGKMGNFLLPFRGFIRAWRIHKKHPYDTVWGIMASYGGIAALLFKIYHPQVRFLLSLQEGDSLEHIKKRARLLGPIYKKIFRTADHIHTISHFLADVARANGYKKEISVIPNGVDIKRFTAIPERDYSGDITVITTSRLVHKNGVDTLIRAMRLLPDRIRLVIVGDGRDRDELQTLAEANQLEHRIQFVGAVPPEKIPGLLSAAHIFARPSRSEGLGNSFLEAFASGIPVVGTPVGGIPDFLFDLDQSLDKEPTGLFAEVDNPESVSEAIRRLVDEDPLRERIIKNARVLVEEKYEWNKITRDLEKIL